MRDTIVKMFEEAVEQDIEFNVSLLGDNEILGLDPKSVADYSKFTANKRLESLDIKGIYPNNTVNPFKHLEKIANEANDPNVGVKGDFFSDTVTEYSTSNGEGWDF